MKVKVATLQLLFQQHFISRYYKKCFFNFFVITGCVCDFLAKGYCQHATCKILVKLTIAIPSRLQQVILSYIEQKNYQLWTSEEPKVFQYFCCTRCQHRQMVLKHFCNICCRRLNRFLPLHRLNLKWIVFIIQLCHI